jgi:iron complex transport system substrate-binding protein
VAGALLVALVAMAAACGDDEDGDTSTDDAAGGGESVTVEHALGTTTIEGTPERVVALGPADLDAALALGAPVVGAASSGLGDGVPPWTQEAEGADDMTVLEVTGDASQVDLEEVAALDPDLILAASYYDIDAAYEQLSEIAPTIAYENGPVTDTWQQITEQVGTAVGEDEAAVELIADVEGELHGLAAGNPQLDGKTFTFGYILADGAQVLRDPDDVMMTVPSALGLRLSEPVMQLPEGESFAVPVSFEQLDVMDADVLALYDGGDTAARQAFEASPLYAALPVVERDAIVDLDDDQFYALRQPTALALPWAVETVAPGLIEAASR